jgi:YfiR/HmsC-like
MFTRNFIPQGFCLLLSLLLFAPWNAPAQSNEYQIKAAFLYNFAQFVEWPPAAFASTTAPFYIGVLGKDPFGKALDETVQGETIGNRKIIIQRSQQLAGLKSCQVIFISQSEKEHAAKILSELDSKPVLTVSEIAGFDQLGGIINFYLEGTKVRFEINPTAARHDGLKISAQLLSLGKIVQSAKEDK